MAKPKSKDKESAISLKISENLKDSLSVLAEFYNTDFSGYVRQVLQANVKQNAELINKAVELKKNYDAERNKLFETFAQDLKGGDDSNE